MNTKTSERYRKIRNEQRKSRLKRTKDFILMNTTASLMNNHKWQEIFNWIDQHHLQFELKTLLSDQTSSCDRIRELEATSILIDDMGDFIEFLEIEAITVKKNNELIRLLDELNIDYHDRSEWIEIKGYQR